MKIYYNFDLQEQKREEEEQETEVTAYLQLKKIKTDRDGLHTVFFECPFCMTRIKQTLEPAKSSKPLTHKLQINEFPCTVESVVCQDKCKKEYRARKKTFVLHKDIFTFHHTQKTPVSQIDASKRYYVRLKEAKSKGYDYVSDCVLDGAMEVR
jgi:hypothetical protein